MSLPPLDDELTPKKLDLKALRPKGDDARIERNTEKLGEKWLGAKTIASLRIEIPEYVDHELAMRAASERTTKQYIVKCALRAYGIEIAEEDMVPDKRKAKR
jgi:hypothetical protein